MPSKNKIFIRFTFCLFWMGVFSLSANESLVNPIPLIKIPNLAEKFSLINSVDFHPQQNLFCVTYTHNNKVILYTIDANDVQVFQSLGNPLSKLSEPQHAVFSPDGEKIVVANWTNQTLTVYNREKNGFFCTTPSAIIPSPRELNNCKPHGIAFSPCGKYLAIAYGVISSFERAVAVFRLTEDSKKGSHFERVNMLKSTNVLPGIPKGITFSPDGTCLLVTFCDVNSLVIYNVDQTNQTINPIPRQTIQGPETKIFRPEDVKISPDGNYCAITNSEAHTVTFYLYDKKTNFIMQNTPCHILQNPEAQFCFPHGLAFSADGSFLAITQFGPVRINQNGGISWDLKTNPSESTTNLYNGIHKSYLAEH